METIHQKYMELTGKRDVPKVIVLDNLADRDVMQSHIDEHFDHSIPVNGVTIDEFLDIHRDAKTKELECNILVRYNKGKESFYFESHHIKDKEVQDVLKRLPIGGELHVHLKGENSEELAKQLKDYFATKRPEPTKDGYVIGQLYKSDGYHCINVKVSNENGFHMRVVSKFIDEANKYSSEIKIIKDGTEVDGRSIFSLMALVSLKDTLFTLKAKGEDAEKALNGLYNSFENKFGIE